MTFDILLDYEKAFGAPPDEEMLKVFAGAAASGMSERIWDNTKDVIRKNAVHSESELRQGFTRLSGRD